MQASPSKNNNLRSVTAASTVWNSGALDFFLFGRVVRPKSAFYAISVRQSGALPAKALLSLYIRLPSNSASRRTPLPSANASRCRAHSGLSPPSYCPCRAHRILCYCAAVAISLLPQAKISRRAARSISLNSLHPAFCGKYYLVI